MINISFALAGSLFMLLAVGIAQADATLPVPAEIEPAETNEIAREHTPSPWLLVPLLSNNPKMGTSASLLGGYIMHFDEKSAPSMIAMQVQTSSTHSNLLGAGGMLYFNENRDRLFFGLGVGQVKNDYADFLGTGRRVQTNDNLQIAFARYQHEIAPSWFIGVQALKQNYQILGETALMDNVLDAVGLSKTNSVGIGGLLLYDSRDIVGNPTKGLYAQIDNMAYRKGLGSDDSYDVLNADARWFIKLAQNNVLVLRGNARWTSNAPASAQSSLTLRGYTRGQYLGKHSISVEAEDRIMIAPNWGVKAFAGAAMLYGNIDGHSTHYPMFGGGLFYLIKPKENMLVSAEFAKGKDNNSGFYLRFGHPF